MDTFPVLPGLTWSVLKAPKFASRIQSSISGRELRVLDQPYPIWTWTLTYEFLRDGWPNDRGSAGWGSGHDELRTLMGFFLQQQGSFNTFLYRDPTDNYVTGQFIGTGNGTLQQFQLYRNMWAFFEPITQPVNISAIMVNNVPYQNAAVGPPPNWTLGANGVITIAPAPPAGQQVTATFTYVFPVRFQADTFEWDNFMYQLWTLKQIKFQSVLLP